MGSVLGEFRILLVSRKGSKFHIFSGVIRFLQSPAKEVEQYDMGPIQHPCHIQFIRACTSHLLSAQTCALAAINYGVSWR